MRQNTGRSLGGVLCACALALAAFAPAAGAACPNEALRIAQGATALPGCRALEMASPPKKFSQPAYLPSFSEGGVRLQMVVRTALAGTPGYQFYTGDRYIASRTVSDWAVSSVSPLDSSLHTASGRRWGSAFSPGLNNWAQLATRQQEYQVGVAQLFEGGLDGSFQPLSPLLIPIDDSGSEKPQTAVEFLELSASSADLSTSVLQVTLGSTSYLPDDPRREGSFSPENGGDTNSYVAFPGAGGQPDLQLLARDKDDEVWGGRCGAHLGGPGGTYNSGTTNPLQVQGAISPGGERIYFSTRPNQFWNEEDLEGPPCSLSNGLRVLKRVTSGQETTITEIAPGAGPAVPGDDLFQAASADGTKVYLLSPRKLTGDDNDANSGPCSGTLGASKGCDLYLYDENRPPGDRIVLASGGPEEASVLASATAVSGDGSRAYFVAQGVLTADTNPEGASAAAGQPNLYAYDAGAGQLAFIATLSASDASRLWDNTKGQGFNEAFAAPLHGAGPEEGGDGHILAFTSRASITGDDGDGGFRDVFRYDAEADAVERISKAAPGGSDDGEFDAFANPAWNREQGFNFNEATRWVSEDGELIGFATKEALIPSDEDEAMNSYFWEAGTLGAAPGALFDEGGETRPPAIAPKGGQVAFSTSTQLVGFDNDVVEDVYVAPPDGGFPEPAPLSPCQPLQEGSCEGPPSPKPAPVPLPADGSNVKPSPKCKKGQVRSKGKCLKKKKAKGKASKRASRNQGGRV
jgi:hypothetical protein